MDRINSVRNGQTFLLKIRHALCHVLINNVGGILYEAGCRDFGNFGSHCLSFCYQASLIRSCPRISTLWRTRERLFSSSQFNLGTK